MQAPYLSDWGFLVKKKIERGEKTTMVERYEGGIRGGFFVIAECAEGLGFFDQECKDKEGKGYPIINEQERYKGNPTCKAIDMCGIQAHAGYYMIGSGGKEVYFGIEEFPSLYLTMKAEKDTDTCLLLLVHDKKPRDFMRRFVTIGKTPGGNHGCVPLAEDYFTIKDDNKWHDYTYDLRKLQGDYPDAETVRMVQFYSGKLCNGNQQVFHFSRLVFGRATEGIEGKKELDAEAISAREKFLKKIVGRYKEPVIRERIKPVKIVEEIRWDYLSFFAQREREIRAAKGNISEVLGNLVAKEAFGSVPLRKRNGDPPPVIDTMCRTIIPLGGKVTIYGENFVDGSSEVYIQLDDCHCTEPLDPDYFGDCGCWGMHPGLSIG